MPLTKDIFKNQSPWGSGGPSRGDGNGSGSRREPPSLDELINKDISLQNIRDVSYLDLLGRDEVQLDNDAIENFIKGKRILITGAMQFVVHDAFEIIVWSFERISSFTPITIVASTFFAGAEIRTFFAPFFK